jgi:hypothetical protein
MPASAPASQLNAGRRVPGLTDPTFDPPGEYKLSYVALKKVVGPALTATQVGSVDAVLVSHDQHADNSIAPARLAPCRRHAGRRIGAAAEYDHQQAGRGYGANNRNSGAAAVLRKESGRDAPKIMRFLIGNPLIMKEMAKHVADAASYAPVTVLAYERSDGVHLCYDTMASLLRPYANAEALAIARNLDAKIENLLHEAAGS